ncbi:glutathione S-transferase T3-like [Raphanus sativus]|uniref:Glutathione S-transferase T3-like n=1 Tax=Raphanus sativus TaxID=3726 RepID=A0A6J0N511_RAPSA|nr:glutathione S-transferase T3-like [Raphanus sativus]
MEHPPQTSQTSLQRKKWSIKEDVVLISAWLNTSKDAIMSTDQKAGAFWKRIVDYVNASPVLSGAVPREWSQCKQRWGRINEQVCKFVGCYEAAVREQASGQNENDVMKAAHDIFFNDLGIKFTLEHCWRELRFDQKWKSLGVPKEGPKRKVRKLQRWWLRRKVRRFGLLVSRLAKQPNARGKGYDEIHSMLAVKKEIQQQKVLERLLAKDPTHLSAKEITLIDKLISEMI